MIICTRKVFSAFLIFLFAFTALLYGGNKPVQSRVNVNNSGLTYTKLSLNNLSTFIYNNGFSDINLMGNSGLAFPRGGWKAVVFQSGFVWGGKVNDNVRVGGSTYQSGLQPGRIISAGVPEDTNIAKTKIYRVRPDYKTADLTIEATEEGKTESEIRAKYEKDWMEWPASEGAPFWDKDGDGKYDPYKDIPGVKDAIQTIWFTANDLDAAKTQALYGSLPLGLELQTTIWAYDKDWILNNTYFKKFKIINKGNNNIKDMHLSLWTDPDVGDATDDFAGCDTLLNLGYVYNANSSDGVYSSMPPAVGFKLLQGPVVPAASDSAIFNGNRIYGKKNLPMTAFYYHVNGVFNYADPLLGSDYNRGTLTFYRLLQGKMSSQDDYYPVPAELGGGKTKFPLSGDPVMGTGYLDGKLFPKGDRRIGLSSGPFNMAPGDTQEVVFSEIVAQSSSNISSVKLLKLFASEIQKKYDSFFKFQDVAVPEAPKPAGTYSKNSITLKIPENLQIENFDKDGFSFQGYNIYQLPSGVPEKKGGVYLGTVDKIDGITSIVGRGVDTLTGNQVNLLQQKGTDSGILREITFSHDSLGHAPFLIGKKYYFGISAYTYRNDPVNNFTNTESRLGVLAVTFQDSLPGPKYNNGLKVTRISGQAEGTITPIVIDASKLTHDTYQVGFSIETGTPVMYVKDLTRGYTLTDNQSASYGGYFDPVYDGIYVKVNNVQPGVKEWQIPQGTRKWSWSGANLGLEGFNGAIGYGGTWLGTSANVEKLHNVLIKFASTDTSGNLINTGDPNVSYAYRYLRNSNKPAAKPEFEQFIINKGSGYLYQDFVKNFPFAAYDIEDPAHPRRLAVGYLEHNISNGLLNGKYWPPRAGQDNIGIGSPREWFFIFSVPYSETSDASLQGDLLSGSLPVLWMGTPTRTGSFAFSSDDQFMIIRTHPFTSEDVFTFTADKLASANSENVPLSYEMSQNYPNPFNPVTTIRYSIPEAARVELKVFDILGREVMTLVNQEQNAGRYNVQFDAGRLSSGIYIYRISAKNFTKTSKMVLLK
ncbi:MAG TPA: T9SS type A sorting domain-containing protein [Ignavibacteriales bacterium]|nr:T9SS type A sorting domain-containing protein [Ignavibacteriales bacterium]